MKNIQKLLIIILPFLLSFILKNDGEKIVEVDKIKFHVKIMGKGNPSVIFESGMGDGLSIWKSIPDSISKSTKVFLYDRAGLGKSGLAKSERTIPNMVQELKQLLNKEKIKPPYIFVTHSMGGYIGRYFIDRYPSEVKGILLIDPSVESDYDMMTKDELNNYKSFADSIFKTKSDGQRKEWENYLSNREYVRSCKIPELTRVVLLSATYRDIYKYQSEIIKSHPNAKQIRVEGGHYIQLYNPNLIIQFIKELIK